MFILITWCFYLSQINPNSDEFHRLSANDKSRLRFILDRDPEISNFSPQERDFWMNRLNSD